LSKCPKCQKVLSTADTRFCEHCGFELAVSMPTKPASEVDDDLDFVVTEAHEEGPEFVGGLNKKADRDDLGLQSTADLMEQEATGISHNSDPTQSETDNKLGLIGNSEPPLPPGTELNDAREPITPPIQESQPVTNPAFAPEPDRGLTPEPPSPPDLDKNRPQPPTTETNDTYLSDEEKQELIKKIENVDQPFGNEPIVPPKKKRKENTPPPQLDPDVPKPAMAKRSRGIALFYKNYIQIKGDQHLHDNVEMEIGDRAYVLREKRINPKLLLGIAIPIFVIVLFIIGAQFIRDTGNGQGHVVGIMFDDNQQPYLLKAEIRFPELGESFYSNPQGFFKTSTLPSGTHKVEYIIDGNLVAIDYATVFNDEITTLMLEPQPMDLAESSTPPKPVKSAGVAPAQKKTAASKAQTSSSQQAKSQSSDISNKRKSSPSTKVSINQYAKLTLDANIDDARLKLDGSVMGAGNLTFSKVKPGTHNWVVSKDGYEALSGTINLKAGESKKLKVTLHPLTTAQKEKSYNEQDFYYSGQDAFKKGDYQTALVDFSKAVELKNSFADAYNYRAETQKKLKDFEKAHDDFLRAAEIYQFRKNINQAITAYNKAIKVNSKSITAHLGRGNLYLNKGEEIAAIADFETVHDLDKKNAQAYYGLGEARFRQGYYKKAVEHFKDARSLDKKNPKVYQYLMLSYLGANDIKNVKKSYDKFKNVATDVQIDRMNTDKKYTAVMRVVKSAK